MSIKGLTDRQLAFPQIGNVRKGAAKDPNANRPGFDLKWFRVEFDAAESETQARFLELYGDKPTDIDIVLPFDDIERVWDPWCEAYTAGRMVARSDGEFFVWLSDLTTGKSIVQNGVDEHGAKVPHRDVIGRAGNSDIKCRPVGRLKIIIPALKRAAYLVVHTTSVIDVRNISEQLRAIAALNGGHIAGIPLVLRRRPKMVSCPDLKNPGKKVRREKWMISIEADPKWVEKMLSFMGASALPSGNQVPALPGVDEDEDEDVENYDGEWVESDQGPEDMLPAEVEKEQTITLEEALSMTNSRGDKYGDMDTPTLEKLKENVSKAMGDPAIADDYYHELGKKHTAIVMILSDREDTRAEADAEAMRQAENE